MDSPTCFGDRLRQSRRRHVQKPSFAAVERLVREAGGNIKASRLNRLELGYADPTPDEIVVLAKALGIPLSALSANAAGAPAPAPSIPPADPAPAGPVVSPEALELVVPQRKSTDDSYTYRSLLIHELGRVRDWSKNHVLCSGDPALLQAHRARLEAALAETRTSSAAALPEEAAARVGS